MPRGVERSIKAEGPAFALVQSGIDLAENHHARALIFRCPRCPRSSITPRGRAPARSKTPQRRSSASISPSRNRGVEDYGNMKETAMPLVRITATRMPPPIGFRIVIAAV